MPNDFFFPSVRRDSLFARTLRAVTSGPRGEWPDDPKLRRHAVGKRLTWPVVSGGISVPWMGDDGRMRVDRGYYVLFGTGGADSAKFIFRSEIDGDRLAALAFLEYLSACLRGKTEGVLCCGVNRGADALSDGESMRLCGSFGARMKAVMAAETPTAVTLDMPAREQGYMERWISAPAPELCDGAVECGLCHFARAVLHRWGREGLLGKSLAVYGGGDMAAGARKQAGRMGARVVAVKKGEPVAPSPDVVFLFDTEAPLDVEAAEGLIALHPDGVFEGVPLACTPEAAARMAEAGLLFAPAAAVGAIRPDMASDFSGWAVERAMRRAAEELAERLWERGPWDLYRAAYGMALETAAAALLRRGI